MPNLWLFLIPTIIFGLAQGVNVPSIQTLLAEFAPLEYRAAFMSINGMVIRMGQTLGPLLMGASFLLWGFEGTFFVSACLSIAMFILALGKNSIFHELCIIQTYIKSFDPGQSIHKYGYLFHGRHSWPSNGKNSDNSLFSKAVGNAKRSPVFFQQNALLPV